ncbi:efflux RND transporter periplasmic adaptor subunit [Hartmannibacter diazotrophicus]|uniref:efflux RND transporter periplasmic adaptor subunit n=1 Tax=Hartmannibacter diazotrophicus TaxID=1482074 RepID=UPI001AECB2A3|nr:efflux RND transporter periplasmic adaptor subunit [Hartmannibacter diazotrophicus]
MITVETTSAPMVLNLPGRVTAYQTAEIRPQVQGIINEQVFRQGSEVKAGDVLFKIKDASYQAAVDAAKAAVQKAEATMEAAKAKADRFQRLALGNSTSQQDIDDANASYQEAKADLALAKADLETAEINLNHTVVTSPISGQIGLYSASAGALVTANQSDALATVRQLDPIYVDATDSSANFLRIRKMLAEGTLKGNRDKIKVHLTLEDGSTYDQTGSIESLEPVVSQTTGTFSVRIKVFNPDRTLLPGMYVRAAVDLGNLEGVFLVPQRAVSRNAKGEATVMVVDADGKVETKVLETSQTSGTNWIVRNGLDAGDRVIIEGRQNVVDGAQVAATEMTLDENTGLAREAEADPATAGPLPKTGG